MPPAASKVKVTVHEKDFEVEVFEKNGKVFAKTTINHFGEIIVPDFGGGKTKVLENVQARIGNILRSIEADEARANRAKAQAEGEAQPTV